MNATRWLHCPGVENYRKDAGEDTDHVSKRCEEFVDEERSWIRQDMKEWQSQYAQYTVERENKKVLRQCLTAHKQELSCCVCPCLISEMERAWNVKEKNKIGKKVDCSKDLEGYVFK